jgi:hypothetical protein
MKTGRGQKGPCLLPHAPILPSPGLLKVTIDVVYLQHLFDRAVWRYCYANKEFSAPEILWYAGQTYKQSVPLAGADLGRMSKLDCEAILG